MPNFSSLAGLEVAEKFLLGGWGGWGVEWGGLHSHFHVKPNRCVVLCCVEVRVLTINHQKYICVISKLLLVIRLSKQIVLPYYTI